MLGKECFSLWSPIVVVLDIMCPRGADSKVEGGLYRLEHLYRINGGAKELEESSIDDSTFTRPKLFSALERLLSCASSRRSSATANEEKNEHQELSQEDQFYQHYR